jgi:hypothetical protein
MSKAWRLRSLVCCDGNQFSGADQRGREEMLMITACIAAALLLVALPIGLSVINHPRRRGE